MPSLGMKCQCSVLESPLAGANPLETPTRSALWGNCITGSPSYKNSTGLRTFLGIYSFWQVGLYENSGSQTIAEYLYYNNRLGYTTQTDSYDYTDYQYGVTYNPATWTAISTVDGNGSPIFSGNSYNHWDTDYGSPPTYTGVADGGPYWAYRPMATPVFTSFYDTPVEVNRRVYHGVGMALDGTPLSFYVEMNLTGEMDQTVDCDILFADMQAQTWNWGTGYFGLAYNRVAQSRTGVPQDLTGFNPAAYDGALLKTSASAASLNPYSAPYQCRNGWVGGMGFGNGRVTANLGIAKNTTGVEQPYYIARYQSGVFQPGNQDVIKGETFTRQLISIHSMGKIADGLCIGGSDSGSITFPFPNTYPTDTIDGSNLLSQDFYFAVIGSDPFKDLGPNALLPLTGSS